jgi:hypothetical protein
MGPLSTARWQTWPESRIYAHSVFEKNFCFGQRGEWGNTEVDSDAEIRGEGAWDEFRKLDIG